MSPFFYARGEALQLRRELVGDVAERPVKSKELLAQIERVLNLGVQSVAKTNKVLKGGNATLRRKSGFIYYRDDYSWAEQAYLIAHELGHFRLDPEADETTIHVNSGGLSPASQATVLVEAYGARERDELQKNVFGRELLLPRSVARQMFANGYGPRAIADTLGIPLEVARHQVLDAILLPQYVPPPPQQLPEPSGDQQKAINATEKYVHVVAGPGTGKTTTLIHRVKKLIELDGVEPRKILVLTFTNKAAAELVERLQRSGVKGASEIWAGTFHAFGLEFLRKYYQHFDIPAEVAVADKITQLTLTAHALANVQLEHYRRTDDPYEWLPPIIDIALRLKEELVGVDHYLSKAMEVIKSSEEAAAYRDVAKVADTYNAALKHAKLVDFVDLVAIPATAIAKDRAKFSDVADRYQHVLVDEFQDMTTAMIQLVSELSRNAKALWVVGDVRQAIYHWRGASIDSLLGFGNRFADAKRYDLVTNRRSVQEVVDLTVTVGAHHPLQRYLPLPEPECKRGASGRLPVMMQGTARTAMWKALVADVRQKVADGIPLKDQTVIARRGAVVSAAARALQEAGISTLYVGNLLERPEIKDILAVIQLVVERSPRAMFRVGALAEPPMELADVQTVLTAAATDSELQRLGWLRTGLPPLSSEGEKSRADLCKKLDGFAWSTTPWEFICELLLERRFLLVDLNDGSIDGHLRRLALWQFAYMSRTGDGDRKRPTLFRFFNRLRLRQQVGDVYIDRELPPETNGLNGIHVMTVHASKGLEFRAVHLCGVHGNDFAGANQPEELLPPECVNSSLDRHKLESDVECNNLLYVAVSRAKDVLSIYENSGESPFPFVPVEALSEAVQQRTLQTRVLPTATAPVNAGQSPLSAVKGRIVAYEELLTYDRCPRQYLYRFGMEMGQELSPNPSLQARGLVTRTLKSVARENRFDLALDTFNEGWNKARLPEPSADPQLWTQAWSACERGARYLQSVGGRYLEPMAEVHGLSLLLPWGMAVAAPGGVRLHGVGFYSASTNQRGRLDRLLGQMMQCTTTMSVTVSESILFDINRELFRTVRPVRVTDWSLLSTRADGLAAGDYTPDKSGYPCTRCSYVYVCPSLMNK